MRSSFLFSRQTASRGSPSLQKMADVGADASMLDARGQVEKGQRHPTAVRVVVTAPLNRVLVAVTPGPGAVRLAMLGASPPLQRHVMVLMDVEQEDGLWAAERCILAEVGFQNVLVAQSSAGVLADTAELLRHVRR